MYRWIFFYGPLWATITCVTILMGMLTRSVMREERDMIVTRNRSNDRTSFADEEQDDFETNNEESGESNIENDNDCTDKNNGRNGESNNESQSVILQSNGNNREDEGLDQSNITNNSDTRPQLQKTESIRLERTRKMFYQAILYVGVFYLTWTIPTVLRFMQVLNCHTPFSVLALTACLAPMQGFWNWLVYRHGPCVA